MKQRMLIGALTLAIAVFQLTACKKMANPATTASAINTAECSSCLTEQAFPEIAGKEVVFHYGGHDIAVLQKGDKYILGGDIILSPQQVAVLKGEGQANGRAAVNSITRIWPNRTVYYTINPSMPNQSRITDAIAHWQSVTNLVFVPWSGQANYILFTQGSGCSSNVGMTGGQQTIYLADGCSTGNAIHEIGHAVGFYHEQTRNDRDNSVIINWSNIASGYENNFKKYSDLGLGGLDLGVMDFGSIMLYDSYAFSSNGLPTIVKKDGSTFTSQRTALSAGDIETYDYLYNRPYLVLENRNVRVINTPQERGRMWDVYVKAYTDASKTTPIALARNLEVHYAKTVNDVTSRARFTFSQGLSEKYLGTGEYIINLVGTKTTYSVDYGLLDLIQ